MNEQKLLPCPFCGNPDVQIWEQAPGLYYVCCNGQKGGCGARTTLCEREKSAVNEWNRRATLPDNKALTVEELREMEGEPVWIVAHPDWGHWELSERAEDYFEDRDEDFYGMTMPPVLPDPMGEYGLHMLGWLAYRRPPEKGE